MRNYFAFLEQYFPALFVHLENGGVIEYPVMQAYGSLALEDNSEVGERCWADVVFPVSASVPLSSQPKKQTQSLQWVLLRE